MLLSAKQQQLINDYGLIENPPKCLSPIVEKERQPRPIPRRWRCLRGVAKLSTAPRHFDLCGLPTRSVTAASLLAPKAEFAVEQTSFGNMPILRVDLTKRHF